jgi:hypothetical protein
VKDPDMPGRPSRRNGPLRNVGRNDIWFSLIAMVAIMGLAFCGSARAETPDAFAAPASITCCGAFKC